MLNVYSVIWPPNLVNFSKYNLSTANWPKKTYHSVLSYWDIIALKLCILGIWIIWQTFQRVCSMSKGCIIALLSCWWFWPAGQSVRPRGADVFTVFLETCTRQEVYLWMDFVFNKRVIKSHKRLSELPCLQDNWDAFRGTLQYRYSLCAQDKGRRRLSQSMALGSYYGHLWLIPQNIDSQRVTHPSVSRKVLYFTV